MTITADHLRTFRMFRDFPGDSLEMLVSSCREIHLSDKEILIEEGNDDESMYIVLSGKLHIQKLDRQIDIAGPGDHVGEMLLIDSQHRSATVRAIGNVHLMEIDEDAFRNHILTEPRALYSMLGTFCERTRRLLDVVAGDFQKLNILVHDMRNILFGLEVPKIYIESLLANHFGGNNGSQLGEDLNNVSKGLERLRAVQSDLVALLDQSLALSTNRSLDYVKGSYVLGDLVRETVEELAEHRDISGKPLRIIENGPMRNVHINYLDIRRVVQNLLLNAGQASPPGSGIEVRVGRNQNSVQVTVSDGGCGIPDDVRPLLLKDRYTSKPKGSGFGLLSCRQIVEDLHGGSLWFETQTNKGTSFHFTLPHSAQASGQV